MSAIAPNTFIFLFYFSVNLLIFWPMLSAGGVFGGVDGIEILLPAFKSPFQFWSNELYGGIPIFAEPHSFQFNPVFAVLKQLFQAEIAYNFYYFVTYSLMGLFTSTFVYTTTGSRKLGFYGGLLIIASSYMVAHLNHVYMIMAGVFIPLAFSGVENIFQNKM